MSHRITSGPSVTPTPLPGEGTPVPPVSRPPAQAQAQAAPGGLRPRTVRAQEKVNNQLRQGIRSIRHPAISANMAEAAVQQAMALGAEPSRPSRSKLRVLMQGEGHGNTALHYLAMYGTPAMSREIIHDPQTQHLDVNAKSRGLVPGGGVGATPLHLAVESFNGEILRDLLAVPGADVQRRYTNPTRVVLAGGGTAAAMSVVEVAEFLARQQVWPAQRPGLIAVLRALAAHGRQNGYTVDCGPLADEVHGVVPPTYGAHERDDLTADPTLPRYTPASSSAAQAGPSSGAQPVASSADDIVPASPRLPATTPPAYAPGPAQPGPSSSSGRP